MTARAIEERPAHPDVVQVFDFGEADGTCFLVMEFIDGVNLRVLFRKATESKTPPLNASTPSEHRQERAGWFDLSLAQP